MLDIRLKGTVNEDLFGRAALTAGYGDEPGPAPGGNANVFSLSPKLNLQAFAESDRFGDQLISLRDLDNIGREAYAAQFELPADFTALTQREGYQSELYGFADYTRKDYHVVGLSGQLDLDSVTTLYAGTFNAYEDVHQASATTQRFVDGPVLGFAETRQNAQFGSKNKLELKTTTKKLRWNTDLNAVYTQGRQRTDFRFDTTADRFRDRFREVDLYANSLLEFRPRAQTGLKLRLGLAEERQRSDVNTQFGSESFREAYAKLLDRDVASVSQERDVRVRSANAELGSQLLSPVGPLSPGVRYQHRWLSAAKAGRGGEGSPTLLSLTLSDTTVSTTQVTPHVAYAFELGGWSANVDVGYAIARYPVPVERETRTRRAWEFNAFVDGSLLGVSVNGAYTQTLSAFPLYQTLPALDILGLQALASPGASTLEPQLQSVLSGAADFEFGKVQVTSAVLAGRTRQSGRFDPAFAPLTVQRYDQLEAGYLLVSNIIDWRPTGWPVRFVFEPEWVTNTQEVRAPGEPSGYTILSRRTLLGVKAHNAVGGKLKYFAYAKYSNFNFLLRDTKTDLGRLEFLSFQLSPKLDLAKGWLQVDPSARVVQFLGSAASTNLLVDLELAHRDEKLDVGLTIMNLFDNDSFRQNTLDPLVFSEQETRIFNRAARVSARFKF